MGEQSYIRNNMKEKLCFLNKKNQNGRIYRPENFAGLDLSKEWYVEKMTNFEPDIRLDLICGRIVNLEIVDDILVGDFIPIDGYIKPNDLVIRPKGSGIMAHNGDLTNYILLGFNMVTKTNDSFNKFYD